MSYREKGLIGLGIIALTIELFFLFPWNAVIGALTFIGFVSFCYWLSTFQARQQKRAREKREQQPDWIKNMTGDKPPIIMPFGKHAGESIEDLPAKYLRRTADELRAKSDPESTVLAKAIKDEIEYRERFLRETTIHPAINDHRQQ